MSKDNYAVIKIEDNIATEFTFCLGYEDAIDEAICYIFQILDKIKKHKLTKQFRMSELLARELLRQNKYYIVTDFFEVMIVPEQEGQVR